MEKKLEKILEEIYALDSSLKARDGEVRELVRALLEVRPVVAPDKAFVLRLRAQVLASAPKSAVSKESAVASTRSPAWMWWGTRLAPIGVFAVLALILVQNNSNTYSPLTPAVDSTVSEMDMIRSAPAEEDGSSAKMAPQARDAATMEMKSTNTNVQNAIDIYDQGPGNTITASYVSLSQEGYIRIREYKKSALGPVIGVSALLSPGSLQNVEVQLSRRASSGELFYAELLASDGDGVYESGEDLPFIRPDGKPVSTIFIMGI